MSFAVIKTGGKQYKVSSGDIITIEKMAGDFKKGDTVTFDEVLLVDDGKGTVLGTPTVEKAKITGTLEDIGRHAKVIVIHFKQKSRYFKKNGHRQPYFKVKIGDIK